MYECVGLVKKNLSYFKKLNDKRTLFNPLNKDFFENYYSCNFAKQILMRRKIKLIKNNLSYIGYIWTDIIDKKTCYINSMTVINDDKDYLSYKYLINFTRKNLHMIYMCQKKNNNFEILTSIGFSKKEGTLIFNKELYNDISIVTKDTINFHVLKRGIDEKIRCDIQNKVFEDEGRIPLTLEDIYYDELQSYYCDDGAIFIKKGKEYIGYGQIILENKTTPVVVNFGIIKKYRGNGYSKLLLMYLIKRSYLKGFRDIKIKVKSSNYIAVNLYKSMGFKIQNEIYNWEIGSKLYK